MSCVHGMKLLKGIDNTAASARSNHDCHVAENEGAKGGGAGGGFSSFSTNHIPNGSTTPAQSDAEELKRSADTASVATSKTTQAPGRSCAAICGPGSSASRR